MPGRQWRGGWDLWNN